MKFRAFVDGQEGTTGLRIHDYLEQRADIAADIAAKVQRHYPTVKVVIDGDRVSVATFGSFDHLKEWGSVNNRPKGYMRSAAASEGDYHPEGK